MDPDSIAAFLRNEQAKIAALWKREVLADRPALQLGPEPVLLDHLGEFLDGLAAWVDGDGEAAERAFEILVAGPELQRLGYGVGLETLTTEYSKLRTVLTRQLLQFAADETARESIVRLHEGMDQAINDAMRSYARRREEVRDRFITILGHDLRDPLSTVAISANLLAAAPDVAPEERVVAQRIGRTCQRMQRMIADVLDFARGHLGSGIPAFPVAADMAAIVRAATDEASGANPERTISCEVSGNLRGTFDRDRVHQALSNLIANAVHHTEGDIEVRAFEDAGEVITEVTSHGAPIPDEVRRRIFDPFASFDSTSPHRGLGLGLYIVQQIALAHGGSCTVHTTERGNTFRIRWPRPSGRIERKAANA